jgi:hypothetical protein
MLSTGDLEDNAVTVTSFSNIGVATVADTSAAVTIDTGIAVTDLATFVGATGVEHVLFNYDIKSLSTATATAVVFTDETTTTPVNLSDDFLAYALTANSGQIEVVIDASPATVATATLSNADITTANALTIVTGGTGFTNGEITLTGATSGVVTTTTFTDTASSENGIITTTELRAAEATGITGTSTGYTSGETVNITQPLTGTVNLSFTGTTNAVAIGDQFAVDFMSFGDSVNNAIYRIELEETGDNTGAFEGSAEYVMLNQINYNLAATYNGVNAIQDDVDMIVHLDMTDEDSIRVNYLDLGADGVSTQIADQQAAPTHSGSADLDLDSYKIADTVVVTITDQDLNTDSELIDVYITTDNDDVTVGDKVGLGSGGSHVADITFDDNTWTGLSETGFTLVETGIDSGIFIGSFQVPENYVGSTGATGTDIEVNYNDHRDSSGNTIEVGDGASIRANTGSVSFDRSVYPVPFDADDFAEHSTAPGSNDLPAGSVIVHISIEDADNDVSAFGEDSISSSLIDVKISRGSLVSANLASTTATILETAPSSGIFEYDLTLASNVIASSGSGATAFAAGAVINQGDIITVTYSDPQDASGKAQTVTDSSSFDLRNGTLQRNRT